MAWLALFDPDVQWGLGARCGEDLVGRWPSGLPLLCGLFVAPWLTMVCRNALAGVVFALAIPATVWLASDLTAAMAYGGELATTVEARELALGIFWRGIVIVCAMAAVASWWMFIRLEAIESRGMELTPPAWVPGLSGRARAMPAAPPAFTRRPAMWLLVKKELRLQQLTFAVSAAVRPRLGRPVGVQAVRSGIEDHAAVHAHRLPLGSDPSSGRIAGQRRGTTAGNPRVAGCCSRWPAGSSG